MSHHRRTAAVDRTKAESATHLGCMETTITNTLDDRGTSARVRRRTGSPCLHTEGVVVVTTAATTATILVPAARRGAQERNAHKVRGDTHVEHVFVVLSVGRCAGDDVRDGPGGPFDAVLGVAGVV